MKLRFGTPPYSELKLTLSAFTGTYTFKLTGSGDFRTPSAATKGVYRLTPHGAAGFTVLTKAGPKTFKVVAVFYRDYPSGGFRADLVLSPSGQVTLDRPNPKTSARFSYASGADKYSFTGGATYATKFTPQMHM